MATAGQSRADASGTRALGEPGWEAIRRMAAALEVVAAAVCGHLRLQPACAAAAVRTRDADDVDMGADAVTRPPAEPEFDAGHTRSGVEFVGDGGVHANGTQ